MRSLNCLAFCSILCLALLVNFQCAHAESKMAELKGIYFFGYEGIDLSKINEMLAFKVGDKVDLSEWLENRKKVFDAVQGATGKVATDAAFVGFQQNFILFIGVPGTTYKPYALKPAPQGKKRLAPEIVQCYEKMIEANCVAVSTGSHESAAESEKLTGDLKKLGAPIADQLVDVVLNSADSNQRMVAAYALGLVAKSKKELDALASAAVDPDSVVRNNAVRELCDSAVNDPALAARVDPACFIHMLSSGTWTDRNKGTFMIEVLSRPRNKDLLRRIKNEALATLIEMAHWNKEHAYPSRMILGRVANLTDDEIRKLISEDKIAVLISAAKKSKKD